MGMPLISVEDKNVFTSSPGTVTFAEFDEFKLRGTGKNLPKSMRIIHGNHSIVLVQLLVID